MAKAKAPKTSAGAVGEAARLPEERAARAADPGGASERAAGTLAQKVAAEIERQRAVPLGGGLFLVATPIGNLGDITVRALTVLARADVIYCEDTRHSRTLVAHYAIEAPLRAYHEHNAEAERPRILELIARGRTVALISDAGTPLISDPGYKLVREAIERELPVTALPGASAVMAGLTVAGLPTDTFLFAGFLPPKDGARHQRFVELAAIPATLVLFEAPSRLARTLAAIPEVFGTREVVVARELTKRFEEIRRGTAGVLAAWADSAEIKGEIVILVAPPGVVAVTDAAIETALAEALVSLSLRDAVREVAEALKAPRSRVYEMGLRIRAKSEGTSEDPPEGSSEVAP